MASKYIAELRQIKPDWLYFVTGKDTLYLWGKTNSDNLFKMTWSDPFQSGIVYCQYIKVAILPVSPLSEQVIYEKGF